ncbi:hypothetical protein [Bradyrhizobium sp. ORS 375]|uniref:hypothetical protein n=1 Tax=Bradyrhizobium sp. (strain ORS 375) TaxID=566679 RepID=UPI0005596853|nr:hypothetical protein [Bradyrhizobium sp. ORS 375]
MDDDERYRQAYRCDPESSIKPTVTGDCGKNHKTLDEWRQCFACDAAERRRIAGDVSGLHLTAEQIAALTAAGASGAVEPARQPRAARPDAQAGSPLKAIDAKT